MRRAQIIAEARSWIGTRWQHQASLKGVGCDCIGFVVGVARSLGIPEAESFDSDPEIKGYGRQPDPHMLSRACARYLDRVLVFDDAKLGDILVLRFGVEPQHFALLSSVDPMYMIHAYAQARKVAENRIDAMWHSRILSMWRFRGIDDR